MMWLRKGMLKYVAVALALGEGIVLASDTPPGGCVRTARLPVVVATDEEWRTAHPHSLSVASAVVREVDAAFQHVCVRLRVQEYVKATSPDSAGTAEALALAVRHRQVAPEGGVVLLLSGQRVKGDKDGWAAGDRPHIVVLHHREGIQRDAAVAAHELGHVLGLGHTDSASRCVMNPRGFFLRWCPVHALALKQQVRAGERLIAFWDE